MKKPPLTRFASAVEAPVGTTRTVSRGTQREIDALLNDLKTSMSHIKPYWVETTQTQADGKWQQTTIKALLARPYTDHLSYRLGRPWKPGDPMKSWQHGDPTEAWQLTSTSFADGKKITEVMPRLYGKVHQTDTGHQARFSIMISPKPTLDNPNSVFFRPARPEQSATWPHEVWLSDPEAKPPRAQTVINLLERLENKTKRLNWRQKTYQLFTQGYWNP